jgi:hypothetical protein
VVQAHGLRVQCRPWACATLPDTWPIRRGGRFPARLDNALNRAYYETQNYFVSQLTPLAPAVARIHGTPGYPLTAVAGLTFQLRGK